VNYRGSTKPKLVFPAYMGFPGTQRNSRIIIQNLTKLVMIRPMSSDARQNPG